MAIEHQITDRTQLRTVYRGPSQGVIDKVIDHIDAGAARFVQASPFVVLSTATADRADASPRRTARIRARARHPPPRMG